MTGRLSSQRLVGREEEFARLRAAIAEAAAGQARFVLVAGETGIGKSRLVAEVAASLGPEFHWLTGGCLAIAHGGLPYAPLAEALRRLRDQLDDATLDRVLGPARAEVASLVPNLADEGELPARPAGGTDQARFYALLLGVLQRLAADRPVLLIIEDVHWVDGATRALLTYLVANLRSERVAIVATLRTDEAAPDSRIEPWLAELLRRAGSWRIDLNPLSVAEVAEQLQEILGEVPAPGLVATIAARSGGNALFVEELAGAAVAVPAKGDSGPGTSARLPASLRDLLTARIRGLPPESATVLRPLAVAGRAVDDRLLVAATGLPEAAVHAALRDAIERHLVSGESSSPLVDLRHPLIRETIVGGLMAGERRSLHAALAAALVAHPEFADASPAAAAAELAEHWAAADRPGEAFWASLAASDAAMAVKAFAEAARHRRRAVDLLARLPREARAGAPDEIALLLQAEEAANLAGDFAASAELLERGLQLVDVGRDATRAGILESRLGYQRWLAGRSEEALAHHARAVALVPAEPPSLERARVLRALGGALMGAGRYLESAAVCEQAVAAARAADAPVEEGRALDMLGMDRFGAGDVEGGIAALRAACAIARAHDPGDGLIVGLHNLAYHLGLADRPDEALAAALEGIAAARREGLDRRYGIALRAAAADVLLRLGRWDEADALVAEGRALDPDNEGSLYLVIVRLRLATARGRWAEARRALAAGVQMAAGDVDFDLVAYLRIAEAELACWTGRPDSATAAVEAGLAALEGTDDVFLAAPLLALGARAAADRAEAAAVENDEVGRKEARLAVAGIAGRLDALTTALDERGSTTRGLAAAVEWARAECLRAEAACQAAAGRRGLTRQIRQWGRLAAAWRDLGVPFNEAYCRLRRAEAMLARPTGRRAATGELVAAAEQAARLGAGPLAATIADLALRLGIDLTGAVQERGPDDGSVATAGAGAMATGEGAEAAAGAGEATVPAGIGEPEPVAWTFMITDIVGSTALVEAVGDAAWSTLRGWHDETLRRHFAAHGGVEVDHAGDGFFVAFPAAQPAVACAVEIQRTLAQHRLTNGFAPAVRIGLHHGEAVRTGTGWAGRAVHVAARLAARAGAGEILASAATVAETRLEPLSAEPLALPGLAGTVPAVTIPWR
jgi:class 3 adenylate cyclase/tetratricopeptide (TPR) repeat protein